MGSIIIKTTQRREMERITWTKKEDDALQATIAELGPKFKWTDVDSIMRNKYNIHEKSAKKCRERWNSKLNPDFSNQNWTFAEEEKMLQIQDQLGNKWSLMRQIFQNRTDVFLKNQFNSVFRKGLRKINNYFTRVKKRQFKPFSSALMNNILTVNEMRFSNRFGIPGEIIALSQQIKSIIIKINDPSNQERQDQIIESVLKPMLLFKTQYKHGQIVKNKVQNALNFNEQINQMTHIQSKRQISPTPKQENLKTEEIKISEFQRFEYHQHQRQAQLKLFNLVPPYTSHYFTPLYPNICFPQQVRFNFLLNPHDIQMFNDGIKPIDESHSSFQFVVKVESDETINQDHM